MLGISVCHFMSLRPISYSSHWCGFQFHAREIWQHFAFCLQASTMLLHKMKHVAFLLEQPEKVGMDWMLTLTMNLCLLLPMGSIEIHFISVLRRLHWKKHLLQAFWVAFLPLFHCISHSSFLGSPPKEITYTQALSQALFSVASKIRRGYFTHHLKPSCLYSWALYH